MVDKLFESNQQAVLTHYGKTEEDFNNDIQRIKQWLDKQSHLPDVYEPWIRVFLVRKKFSLEKTKEVIDIYFRLKHLVPEVFSNWDILSPRLQQAIQTCAWIPLPKLTPEYDAVSVVKLFNSDVNQFNVWESAKIAILVGIIRLKMECNIREHLIFDFEGFTVAHVTKVTPAFLKKMYTVIMKGTALRINAFHILNPPPMFDTLLAIVKPIMKAKLYNRIKIHSDIESLRQLIPTSALPKDYGGNLRPIHELRDLWKKELEKHRDFLLTDEKYQQSDESKRINNKDDDIFGSMHGSFRTLQID